MFGPVGHAYVYFTYGMHHCLNLVARAPSMAAGAVLIRGLEPVAGFGAAQARSLAGPGRLARALGVTTADSGADVVRGARFAVRDAPAVPPHLVRRGPRIGLSGGATAEAPWRFRVVGSAGVSRGRASVR